jgi:hypothetical protein
MLDQLGIDRDSIGAIYPYIFVSIAWDCQEQVEIKNLMQIDVALASGCNGHN